jgi:DNA-binding response OmpR family regulator
MPPRIYRAAGLTLDPHRRTAIRNGRPLDLSVKEFGVLEALLRAAPAFLSTEELLEQVWDENGDPFTRTERTQERVQSASPLRCRYWGARSARRR